MHTPIPCTCREVASVPLPEHLRFLESPRPIVTGALRLKPGGWPPTTILDGGFPGTSSLKVNWEVSVQSLVHCVLEVYDGVTGRSRHQEGDQVRHPSPGPWGYRPRGLCF